MNGEFSAIVLEISCRCPVLKYLSYDYLSHSYSLGILQIFLRVVIQDVCTFTLTDRVVCVRKSYKLPYFSQSLK
jgi:hypothetical protein